MNDMLQRPAATLAVLLEPMEWNIVLAGLGELQLKVSRTVFEKVVRQLQPELQERN